LRIREKGEKQTGAGSRLRVRSDCCRTATEGESEESEQARGGAAPGVCEGALASGMAEGDRGFKSERKDRDGGGRLADGREGGVADGAGGFSGFRFGAAGAATFAGGQFAAAIGRRGRTGAGGDSGSGPGRPGRGAGRRAGGGPPETGAEAGVREGAPEDGLGAGGHSAGPVLGDQFGYRADRGAGGNNRRDDGERWKTPIWP